MVKNGVIFLLFLLGITSTVAAVKELSSVAVAVTVAVEGGCDCCLLYRIYYFIVVDILFYCNGYIILL